MRRRYVPTMHQSELAHAIDKARDYHRSHGAIDAYGQDTPEGLAYLFAEALDQISGDYEYESAVADRCVIGLPCKKHVDMVHGKEAEELRKGIEKILAADLDDYPYSLRELLDEVDARDSLAFCEAKESTK